MYAKPPVFLVGFTSMYAGLFLLNLPLPMAHYPYFILLWDSGGVVVVCWITSTSLSGYENDMI